MAGATGGSAACEVAGTAKRCAGARACAGIADAVRGVDGEPGSGGVDDVADDSAKVGDSPAGGVDQKYGALRGCRSGCAARAGEPGYGTVATVGGGGGRGDWKCGKAVCS